MAFLSVLPVSFSANKVGYNKYLAAGGGLDYAAFKTWERRSPSEVLIADALRYSDAINYAIDMFQLYIQKQEFDMAKCYYETYSVRLKQYFDSIKELKSL